MHGTNALDPSTTDDDREYVEIINNDTVALTAGMVAKVDITGTGAPTGLHCIRTAAANEDGIVKGVVPVGESIAVGARGRVQCYGYHSAVKAATIASVSTTGLPMVTSGTAATADDAAAGTAFSWGSWLSTDSGGTAKAFLHCR